jgi:hypothetical protein
MSGKLALGLLAGYAALKVGTKVVTTAKVAKRALDALKSDPQGQTPQPHLPSGPPIGMRKRERLAAAMGPRNMGKLENLAGHSAAWLDQLDAGMKSRHKGLLRSAYDAGGAAIRMLADEMRMTQGRLASLQGHRHVASIDDSPEAVKTRCSQMATTEFVEQWLKTDDMKVMVSDPQDMKTWMARPEMKAMMRNPATREMILDEANRLRTELGLPPPPPELDLASLPVGSPEEFPDLAGAAETHTPQGPVQPEPAPTQAAAKPKPSAATSQAATLAAKQAAAKAAADAKTTAEHKTEEAKAAHRKEELQATQETDEARAAQETDEAQAAQAVAKLSMAGKFGGRMEGETQEQAIARTTNPFWAVKWIDTGGLAKVFRASPEESKSFLESQEFTAMHLHPITGPMLERSANLMRDALAKAFESGGEAAVAEKQAELESEADAMLEKYEAMPSPEKQLAEAKAAFEAMPEDGVPTDDETLEQSIARTTNPFWVHKWIDSGSLDALLAAPDEAKQHVMNLPEFKSMLASPVTAPMVQKCEAAFNQARAEAEVDAAAASETDLAAAEEEKGAEETPAAATTGKPAAETPVPDTPVAEKLVAEDPAPVPVDTDVKTPLPQSAVPVKGPVLSAGQAQDLAKALEVDPLQRPALLRTQTDLENYHGMEAAEAGLKPGEPAQANGHPPGYNPGIAV